MKKDNKPKKQLAKQSDELVAAWHNARKGNRHGLKKWEVSRAR